MHRMDVGAREIQAKLRKSLVNTQATRMPTEPITEIFSTAKHCDKNEMLKLYFLDRVDV